MARSSYSKSTGNFSGRKDFVMRIHFHQLTEPIFSLLDHYRAELLRHPLLEAGSRGILDDATLHEFAFHQYSDSITWIPMLAQMKSMATRSRRLQAAIRDNIAHEAGLDGTSHVTLAVELMRSMGITNLDRFTTTTFADTASMWLSDPFVSSPEPAIAGWLLTAETLVPLMFAAVKPSFERIANTRYFSVHIAVDADEHASWMAEAVDDVVALYGPACVPIITAGMADAWRETIEVPDALWRQQCASR
ncbi:MAG TPA: iron-containing redox enzyme family protein [Kofleriaceae bacterium]|nr:iron-containing redox enzyme family protein [Kofleriaceae bacterium]